MNVGSELRFVSTASTPPLSTFFKFTFNGIFLVSGQKKKEARWASKTFHLRKLKRLKDSEEILESGDLIEI